MKVAIFTAYANRVLESRKELINSLKEKKHEIVIIGPEEIGEEKEKFEELHIAYKTVGLKRNNTNPFKEITFMWELIRLFKVGKIDAMLVYGIRTFPSVVLSAKMAGIKQVVCIVNGLGNLFLMKGIKADIVRLISFPILKLALGRASQVFIQNSDDYAELKKRKLIKRNNTGLVNGSGVNTVLLKREEMPKEDIFLLVSRLTGAKGINEYLEAAEKVHQKYKDVKIWLVGPKDDLDQSLNIELFQRLCNENVIEYFGETNDVQSYLKRCRYYVLPSYREGTPRTILEAMAVGRPIITTDVPGCRQTVVNRRNGLLVPARNADELAKAMLWMMEHPEEIEIMSDESRKMVEKDFNVYEINKIILHRLLNTEE